MFFLLCKNVLLQINSFLLRGYFFIEIILQSTIDNTDIVYYATESIKMSRQKQKTCQQKTCQKQYTE